LVSLPVPPIVSCYLIWSRIYRTFFAAPKGGLAALHKKAPGDFTAEDAYDVACQTPAFGIGWGWGVGYLAADGPEDPDEMEKGGTYFMTLMGFAGDSNLPLLSRASDASVERACLLLLDLLRAPGTTPPMVLVGAWYTFEEGCRSRSGPPTVLIEAGVLEVAAAVAKDATPLERLRRIAPLPPAGQQSAAEQRELGVSGCTLMAMKEIFENYSVEKLGTRTQMVCTHAPHLINRAPLSIELHTDIYVLIRTSCGRRSVAG
jgi:hypothetical protein